MNIPPFSLEQQLSEIGQDLESAVSRVVQSGQYIGGKEVKDFESSFAESVCVPFAVGCNSGTDSLILALRALDIGPGDEVITVSFSFFATAEAISSVGATPVFVDISPDTYLIDINVIEDAITPSTKAILPVHLFGRPVNMDAISSLAKKHNLKVVEDCAQASGAKWNGFPVGGLGDVGCFSFFPTKNLGAAGDGGAVTTHDSAIARRVNELAVHGMPKRYFHTEIGYNSRLDAIQASILNVKLPILKKWVKQRQEIAMRYKELLKDISELVMPSLSSHEGSVHAWNQFVVRVKKPDNKNSSFFEDFSDTKVNKKNFRDWFKEGLKERGVNTIIYYPIPIHLQPAYQKLSSLHKTNLPETELLSQEVLSLPIYPELSPNQQQYVVKSIKNLLEKSNLASYENDL